MAVYGPLFCLPHPHPENLPSPIVSAPNRCYPGAIVNHRFLAREQYREKTRDVVPKAYGGRKYPQEAMKESSHKSAR